MVMHVASRARLHVWQNRSHIVSCIQTSYRPCLREHTLQWCQVALKLLWIQGLSRIWWMGCFLTLAMNNIFGPCSCLGYNEQFGNCASPPPLSLSAMLNSAWKKQTPPSNCGGPRPCMSGATKEDRPPPPPREQQASTKGNMAYDPGER